MGKIYESPLDCELGDAYLDSEGIPVWEWEPVENVHVSTLYDPGSEDIDQNLMGRYFRHTTAVIEGVERSVMVRVDPDIFPTGFPINTPDLDSPITERLIDGKSKYPLAYAGRLRNAAENCIYGDYVKREEYEGRMFMTEFETDVPFYQLYDHVEHALAETTPDPALIDYVFDREERTVDGVIREYFRRIDLEWLKALIAERNAAVGDD